MATNELVAYPLAENLTVPSGTVSGDPLLIGASLVGVAETTRDANGKATVHYGPTVRTINVKGIDGSGNSAVAIGDKLYITMADSPPVSKKATGVFFGKALGVVTSGSTTAIAVYVFNGS